jgi:o-succinylbenzoate---CoA ligase
VRIGDGEEIHLRGPMLLRAYRDGVDPKDAEGWLPTGDAGSFDDERLSVHGRIGDVIITGGENVWPVAVERVLATHPEVVEVLVAGERDAEWGQRVIATVVPRDLAAPPSLDELRDHAKEWLPAYAAPKAVSFVDELPRTASGKTRRPTG